MPEIKTFYLPRLSPEAYRADAVLHWTLPLFDRATGWLNASFHAGFRELMLHVAVREGLLCPVYCLMPDHLHLVWMRLRPDTDQLHGMAFLRTHLAKSLRPFRFQKQAHDHVLRADEREQDAFAHVCAYVLNNPVEGGYFIPLGALDAGEYRLSLTFSGTPQGRARITDARFDVAAEPAL